MARLLPSSTFRYGIAPHNVTAEIVRPRLHTLGVSLQEVQQPVLHEQNEPSSVPQVLCMQFRQAKGARRPESHDVPFGRPDARRGIGDPQKALSTAVPLLPRTGTSKSILSPRTVNP